MPGRVLLIAHDRTAANAGTDQVQGWMRNSLDSHGRAEAKEAGEDLKDEGIAVLLTSDLPRAVQTAALIGREIGCKPQPSRAWRPLDTGCITGMASEKGRPMIADYLRTPARPIPQGESVNSFRDRFLPALEKVLASVNRSGKTVAIVTHSRDLSLAQDWLAARGDRGRMKFTNLIADKMQPGARLELVPSGDFWRGRLIDRGGQ